MADALQDSLASVVSALEKALGGNLYSCAVYGSAVRGNAIEGVSDINLLIVLEKSDAAAHEAIAGVLGGNRRVDPFVLGRSGFQRSAKAFAPKFASIRRNYRMLHGSDPFTGLEIDPQLERFLCEQAVRNLRLRMAYSFITRGRHKSYGRFLARTATPLFLRLSEILRLEGIEVPVEMPGRIPLFEKELGVDGAALRDLLEFKKNPDTLSDTEMKKWHERLFPVVSRAVEWIESHWKE